MKTNKNTLNYFIEQRIIFAQNADKTFQKSMAEVYCKQAYGALDFYLLCNPEDCGELNEKWANEWRPAFEKIMYPNL